MYLCCHEIGHLTIAAFLLLNIPACRGGLGAGQDETVYSSPLMMLLKEHRFDYHMFGCDCHPVYECVKDHDCQLSKGPDYVCRYQCCSLTCVHISLSDDDVYGDDFDNDVTVDVELDDDNGADTDDIAGADKGDTVDDDDKTVDVELEDDDNSGDNVDVAGADIGDNVDDSEDSTVAAEADNNVETSFDYNYKMDDDIGKSTTVNVHDTISIVASGVKEEN